MNSVATPKAAPVERASRIGRPGYRVTKMKDPDTGQFALSFEINYKEIKSASRPRHRFISAWEQKVEPPDASFQYLAFAAEPYETIGGQPSQIHSYLPWPMCDYIFVFDSAFRIPTLEIDRKDDKFTTRWDATSKMYLVQFYLTKRDSAHILHDSHSF